ncbi:MAG: DinB family protein [bacterium]|nr:DinB family protein [bacterium]
MNTRLSEIVNELGNARTSLYNTVEGLSQHQLDQQPEPGRWSVGEILHHLYVTETGVTKLLEKQITKAEKRGMGPDPENSSLLGSLDQYAFETSTIKIKAPQQVQPQYGVEKGELEELLGSARAELLNVISKGSVYNLSELVFPHPALGRMNMYQWLLFLAKHEERHTAQIKDELEKIR